MHGLYDGDFVGYKIASSAELDAALREAVVAVDANVLLDLYRLPPRTSRDLIKTLRSLGDRLVVPHQALRESWRRRQRAQDSPGGATRAATAALDKSGRSIRDAVATWARVVGVDDAEVSDLIAPVNDSLGALKGELENVSQDASAEGGGDPILEQLEEILAGRVTSSLAAEEWAECLAEAKRRIEAEEPPGYMDADKQDGDLPEGGAGDYLVWYEATRYAKEQDRDLLIVTRDQKEDWWWRLKADFMGPRPELTLEYHQLTGRRLFLMRPTDLLKRAPVALNVEVDQASSADAERVALIETPTPDVVALWMLEELDRTGSLLQADAVAGIEREFGPSFIYENENGNPAIDPHVLREFRELTEDDVIWDRWAYLWRHRQPGDAPGRKQQDQVAREVATLYEFPMSPEQGLSRAQASAAFKKHGLNPRAFGSWVRSGYLAREGDRRWLTSKGREWADSYAEEAELFAPNSRRARQIARGCGEEPSVTLNLRPKTG
jgi:PIN like domain